MSEIGAEPSAGRAFPSARDKIKTVEELGAFAAAQRAAGRTVVLCHGVFDLVHMGHIRHLEAARREGDILLVTTTADKYVNKGPGRPIFGERLRAEMLAAIQYVDGVAINFGPSAEPLLDQIQPDVYVKGSDYENPDEDITGKIASERNVVERHGGRIVFTKDITFSSSSLINRYLDVYDPPLRDYLVGLRDSQALPQLLDLVDRVKDFRVLLIGDAIIDEYKYVTPMGKTPKENMIATLFQNKEVFAGGVFAAANHVASFCKEVEIISALGSEDSYEDLVRDSLKPNVSLTVLEREGVPTTRKCRFIDAGMRKLFEVYFMDDRPMAGALKARLDDMIREKAKDFDLVIVTDFGHGLIAGDTPQILAEHARFLAVNAQSNSANMGFNLVTKYPRADYICIDGPEARLAAGDKFATLPGVAENVLSSRMSCPKIILTHGQHGCVTYEDGIGSKHIPVFTKTTVDTVGAGDAFLAVTSPLVAAGGLMEHVGFVGNAAGAMKVGIVGHRKSVEKIELLKFITALLK